MKIAIDARIIYTSTGRYVERLLAHLQEIDHENEYAVLLGDKDFSRWNPTAANFTKVVANHRQYSVAEQTAFLAQLNSLRADLVHFTMPQQPILYRGRKVTTVHDLTLVDFVNKRNLGLIKGIYKNHLKPVVFRQAIRRFVTSSAAVITPTNFVKSQVVERFNLPEEKVRVTYEAAEIPANEPDAVTQLAGKQFILYVGNAYPYKNLRRLIDAYAEMGRDDHVLVLAGKTDSFYEELSRYARERKLSNVLFTGFVSDDQLAWLYQNASLYVFPSLSEGFGLPGLEAMLYGLPVAASEATSLPEVYGDAAIYFDPEDVTDIAETIDGLLNSPDELKRLKAAGLKHAGSFSWRRMAEQTLAVYEQAVRD